VVDEWGGWFEVENGTNPGFLYQQNTMRDAMIAGATLNIFNNHSDRVKIANLAQCVNVLQAVILTDKEKMLLTPTYHVMEMYKVHQDAVLLPVEVKTDDYTFGGEKLPSVSVSASRNAAGLTHVSVVNINSTSTEDIEIDITGQQYKSVTGRILSSGKMDDHNTFEKPDFIKPAVYKSAVLKNGKLKIKLPPFSLAVLELKS
jgi:alpha-N-arabinofuranosidase